MDLTISKNEIDFIRVLIEDENRNCWTDEFISESLRLTKIFHILSAVKVLKMKDGEEAKLPELDEIKEMLNKIIINSNSRTINGNETFNPDLDREH